MQMINCIIVDDEPLALDILEDYVSRCKELYLVGRCKNALEAFDTLHTQKIDLVFLDIKMPSISGIDFISSLKEPPLIIFITAYPDFALTGFELDAIDYLLKPVTFERFKRSIDKLLNIKQVDIKKTNPYTYFKIAGNLVKINHGDIYLAQSVKDYIHLKTKQGNFLTHMTMKYLENLLPPESFVRVHRSYLINRSKVTLLGRQHLEIEGESIPIGENYRQNFNFDST